MKFQIYQDRKKLWRWRIVSKGRIKADSGEGYSSKSNLLRAIKSFNNKFPLKVEY